MFRSTVPNNMLPKIPKPTLIETPSYEFKPECHMTDFEYNEELEMEKTIKKLI